METSVILALIATGGTLITVISTGYGLVYRSQLKAQQDANGAIREARDAERVEKERAQSIADRSQKALAENTETLMEQASALQSFREIAVMMVNQGTENAKALSEIATRLDSVERRMGAANARRKPGA